MKALITHIKEGTLYHAVEVSRTTAEAGLFFISVRKKKHTLDVVDKSDDLNIKTLSKKLKRSNPLFAVINTPQVLSKVVPLASGTDMAVVNSAFPNINTEDFYYEWAASGRHAVVSVCRKEHVHTVLQTFHEAGIKVAGFALGISKISMIKDLIPVENIVLPNTFIALKNKEIESVEKQEMHQPETYDINGIILESSYLLGFSAVLSQVLKNATGRSNAEAVNAGFLSDFYHNRFFGSFLKSGLGFLLALLLTNFFVFNHYYEKTETLQQSLTLKTTDKNRLMELKQRVEEKQKRVDAILASSSSKSSFYMDRIAGTLPPALLLTEMTYQPLEGRIKTSQEITVQDDVILISGASKNSSAFSDWVETLEKKDWIQQLSILDYDYSNASTSSFTIKIILQHDT